MPTGVEDRNADVWEALLTVADVAGGQWPNRARVSAVTDVTDIRGRTLSLGIILLRDLRTVFEQAKTDRLSTVAILDELTVMDESPWGDLRGKPLDARGLSRRLSKYDVKPKVLRQDQEVFKGYELQQLHDAWSRYLDPEPTRPLEPSESVTSVTTVTDKPVTSVTPQTPRDCDHGVREGNQPDPFVNGQLRCTECRAEVMAS
jgi:hypothetical protein